MEKVIASLLAHTVVLVMVIKTAAAYPSAYAMRWLAAYAAMMLLLFHVAVYLWWRQARKNERRQLLRRMGMTSLN